MVKYYSLFITVIFWFRISSAQHQNIVIGTLNEPNEPSIAVCPVNPELITAGSNLNNYYFSSDGGFSWEESVITSPQLGVWGDPCIIADTLGNFYFFHLSNPVGPAWIDQIVCQKTTDNGATWSPGVGIGLNGDKAQDKEWAVYDPLSNSIYVTWTQFDSYGSFNPADSSLILFSRSTDLGETWSTPVRISNVAGDCADSDNTVEGAVPAIGPDGEIFVAWAGPSGILFDRSTDQGITWLTNDIFVTDQPGGWDYDIPDISRANGLPVTCCDVSPGPNRGTIYINWSDQRNGSNDTDVWLVKSMDGGFTWSQPIRVNDDLPGKQQFFCWMTIDQTNGKLWIVYYDRRNYDDSMTDVYLALSEDGGETFSNFRISESPFYPSSTVFFGDYTNVSAVNNVVRPVWTRLDNFQLSIMTAIIDPLILHVQYNAMVPYSCSDVFPNPFGNTTAITFKLRSEAIVNLILLNSYGQKIATLIDQEKYPAGKYKEILDSRQWNLKSGVYYLDLTTGTNQLRHKLVFVN